jgi:hypothetical protein
MCIFNLEKFRNEPLVHPRKYFFLCYIYPASMTKNFVTAMHHDGKAPQYPQQNFPQITTTILLLLLLLR